MIWLIEPQQSGPDNHPLYCGPWLVGGVGLIIAWCKDDDVLCKSLCIIDIGSSSSD